MSEVRKKFDRNLYERADREAKEAMVCWLKEHDHINIDTNETTYFDIVSTVGPELPRHLYEVEVKYSWKSDEWPDSWKSYVSRTVRRDYLTSGKANVIMIYLLS